MKKFRVVQWGLGAMGSGMARLMLEKDGLELVGGIDMRPDFVGKDLGDVLCAGRKLGFAVTSDPASVLDGAKVDLVVIATTSWTKEQMPDLKKILSAGINCISIAEEMSAPEAQSPALAEELDELAKKNGVSILGTGVNPGFVLDLLVVALSGVCHKVERIEATCDVENGASARVLGKAGLARERLLPAYGARPNLGPGPRDAFRCAWTRPAG